jgi:hypothetical protein
MSLNRVLKRRTRLNDGTIRGIADPSNPSIFQADISQCIHVRARYRETCIYIIIEVLKDYTRYNHSNTLGREIFQMSPLKVLND